MDAAVIGRGRIPHGPHQPPVARALPGRAPAEYARVEDAVVRRVLATGTGRDHVLVEPISTRRRGERIVLDVPSGGEWQNRRLEIIIREPRQRGGRRSMAEIHATKAWVKSIDVIGTPGDGEDVRVVFEEETTAADGSTGRRTFQLMMPPGVAPDPHQEVEVVVRDPTTV